MEYVQMTLNEWVEIKQRLRQELIGVKQGFVRIGYMLRKINDQKGYEQDGYKSITEFAQKELGLHPSTTTRFMEINREYSIDGYSERLRPEYLDLSRSQLEEMLKLPNEDRQMIQPDASREGIRELKRFNNAVPETGANTIKELIEKFFHDNREILNAVFAEELTAKQFSELVNPSGNRSYKKGLYFLMMYENRIAVKRFGETPVNMTWDEFKQETEGIFGAAAGPDTWRNYFGEDEKQSRLAPEQMKNMAIKMSVEQKKEPWRILKNLQMMEEKKRKMTAKERKLIKNLIKGLREEKMLSKHKKIRRKSELRRRKKQRKY